MWVVANGVGAKFFATSGMRIVAGRDFSEQDNERAAKVAVLNETMARHFFGTRSPVGQHIAWAKSEPASIEIVGVVRDIKYIGMREDKMDVIFTGPYNFYGLAELFRNNSGFRAEIRLGFTP